MALCALTRGQHLPTRLRGFVNMQLRDLSRLPDFCARSQHSIAGFSPSMLLTEMKPEIVQFPGILLTGISARTTFNVDITPGLWARFIARIHKPFVTQFAPEQYSAALYPEGFFDDFRPDLPFEKWAAGHYSGNGLVDPSLQQLDISPGLYAVFTFTGRASEAAPFFAFIFNEWLPQSGFQVDTRPHFEILPPGYRPEDPEMTELVYIPVKPASVS